MSTSASLLVRLVTFVAALGATTVFVSNMLDQSGVVTGILYIPGDSSAIVEGIIVRQGDTINGAEVIGIEKFYVEFKKNGVQWKQKVRQKASTAGKDVESSADM